MQSTMINPRQHAVVIGGSMAGLLAARVLSNHFGRVTLLERDTLTNTREVRRGVPQGRHTHGLLAGGRQALEEMFPGLSDELIGQGAVPGDIVRETRWFFEGGCHSRFPSGLDGFLVSRPFLESFVRERVRQLPNVSFLDNCQVQGLLTTPDRSRVTGVQIDTGSLPADLVIDASGRGSHAPQWLDEFGYAKPPEERIEIALNYTTRLFRRSPEHLNGDLGAIIAPTPHGKIGGVIIAQEESRWTVTLLSHFQSAAPGEMEGFIEFARQLPAPYIYDVVRTAEPLGEPATTRFPASVRRRYENLRRFPNGYLVMGDAVCSFNPIYGQGMTVAALEARALDAELERGDKALAARFFARIAKVADIPWSMAAGNDLRIPEAKGPRTLSARLINAYLAKLHKVAQKDPAVTLAFHRVGNLLAPPSAVLHPRILQRVLWGTLRPAAGRSTYEAVRA